MSRKERLWLRLGPARVPVAKFHETRDSLYVAALLPGVGLHLSIHGSGEIHLREGQGDILARTRIPPLDPEGTVGFLESSLERPEPCWTPASDVILFPAATRFPGPLLRSVHGGKELDALRMLRSWRGDMPIHCVEEGHLEDYTARFGGVPSLVLSPEERLIGLPFGGTGDEYLSLAFDSGDPLGAFGGMLEAFPLHEALAPLIDEGLGRLREYEEKGLGFGALFESHVAPHADAIAAEAEDIALTWEGTEPRWRYPTDWEEAQEGLSP